MVKIVTSTCDELTFPSIPLCCPSKGKQRHAVTVVTQVKSFIEHALDLLESDDRFSVEARISVGLVRIYVTFGVTLSN